MEHVNEYSKIVVGYDGSELSEKALNTALSLARKNAEVELMIVTIFNPPVSMGSYGMYSEETIKDMLSEVEKMLEAVEDRFKVLPNKASTHLLQGLPGKRIVEFANERDADVIILGSRGLSQLKELFLGSVSHYVVQHAKCPVFIIK